MSIRSFFLLVEMHTFMHIFMGEGCFHAVVIFPF